MTKIAHQLWRSRAWVMQYIGFINNFALAVLQYFLPVYCLVSSHCALALASLHLPILHCRRTPWDTALMRCISVDCTGKIRLWPGANG
eukprot:COSAG02_NODE_5361_length_4398_cov_2.302163_5_plen_88_part_00